MIFSITNDSNLVKSYYQSNVFFITNACENHHFDLGNHPNRIFPIPQIT